MARKSMRALLVLSPEQRTKLKGLAASRSASKREVERAKVMLGYADGVSITELQRQLGFSRPMIYRCVDKALAAGVQMGLKDKYHRPHEPEISDEAKAWVVSIACTKPKDNGLAAEHRPHQRTWFPRPDSLADVSVRGEAKVEDASARPQGRPFSILHA